MLTVEENANMPVPRGAAKEGRREGGREEGRRKWEGRDQGAVGLRRQHTRFTFFPLLSLLSLLLSLFAGITVDGAYKLATVSWTAPAGDEAPDYVVVTIKTNKVGPPSLPSSLPRASRASSLLSQASRPAPPPTP
jgi:hypothetical protein